MKKLSDGIEFDAAFDNGNGGFAVRIGGKVLPVRFAKEQEAFDHYAALKQAMKLRAGRAAAGQAA